MALTSLADLDARIAAPYENIIAVKGQGAPIAGRTTSLFTTVSLPGTAPTVAEVPVRDIAGALGQQNGGSVLRALGVQVRFQSVGSSFGGTWILCDRLSHQAGLDGAVTGAQTTNLPTAALTRYSDGIGVWCVLEVYTAVGTTATTVKVSYTNQAGTSGQISPEVVMGGTIFRENSRIILIPNAVGDTGFRAVASVELLATTGTAGNFGITLLKPLLFVPVVQGEDAQMDPIRGIIGGGFPEILDDACLFWIYVPNAAQAFNFGSVIGFAED